MATLYNLTQYHFSSALLPVAYLLHFFLESFALKEDEKRRLLHVIRLSLRRFNQQLVHSQTHTNHSTFYSPSTKNSPVLLHYSCWYSCRSKSTARFTVFKNTPVIAVTKWLYYLACLYVSKSMHHNKFWCDVSWPYLSNGRAYGMVVVCPSVCPLPSVYHKCTVAKRSEIGTRLLLITNRKLDIGFQMTWKSMTLDDLEKSYNAIWYANRAVLWLNS